MVSKGKSQPVASWRASLLFCVEILRHGVAEHIYCAAVPQSRMAPVPLPKTSGETLKGYVELHSLIGVRVTVLSYDIDDLEAERAHPVGVL